jgi:hypothetical protein
LGNRREKVWGDDFRRMRMIESMIEMMYLGME